MPQLKTAILSRAISIKIFKMLEDLDLNHTVIGGDLNIYLSTQDKYLGIDSDDRIIHEFKNTLDNLDMIFELSGGGYCVMVLSIRFFDGTVFWVGK